MGGSYLCPSHPVGISPAGRTQAAALILAAKPAQRRGDTVSSLANCLKPDEPFEESLRKTCRAGKLQSCLDARYLRLQLWQCEGRDFRVGVYRAGS